MCVCVCVCVCVCAQVSHQIPAWFGSSAVITTGSPLPTHSLWSATGERVISSLARRQDRLEEFKD